MLVAELLQNNHFLRERLVDSERKQYLAEAAIAELRGKLAHAELALVRGQAPPAGRAPAGKPAPAKRQRRRSLAAELRSEPTGGQLANQLMQTA